MTNENFSVSTATIGIFRTESKTPAAYRLKKLQSGEYVLQGAYLWHEGLNKQGQEWRDIETIAELKE